MDQSPLQRLIDYGQSPWVDGFNRAPRATCDLERLVDDHGIRGASWNPSTLADAIASNHYDGEIGALGAAGGHAADAIARLLAVRDAQEACDVMRPTFEASARRDGHVSLAIDPHAAVDSAAALRAARLVWDRVDRPNLLVAIPATPAGLIAIEEAVARGISVDATLIFTAQRHRDAAEAYLRGIERLIESGDDPSRVTSLATSLVSPVDAAVDDRLEALGGDKTRLKGRTAIAGARLIHESYQHVTSSVRWQAVAAGGATLQRCRWAATSPAQASYCDVLYLEELIGPDTVTTIEPQAIPGFEAHGVLADKLQRGFDDARLVMHQVRAAGVDLDEVWRDLEIDTLQLLAGGFDALVDAVVTRSGELLRAIRA